LIQCYQYRFGVHAVVVFAHYSAPYIAQLYLLVFYEYSVNKLLFVVIGPSFEGRVLIVNAKTR
jgi:hypothetical protein